MKRLGVRLMILPDPRQLAYEAHRRAWAAEIGLTYLNDPNDAPPAPGAPESGAVDDSPATIILPASGN